LCVNDVNGGRTFHPSPALLFSVRRADIETFARELEARGPPPLIANRTAIGPREGFDLICD
jgi:hypothetical protein